MDASVTSAAVATGNSKDAAVKAATPTASVARVSVTQLAQPRPAEGSRQSARARARFSARPQARPTSQPAAADPDRLREHGQDQDRADEPGQRTGLLAEIGQRLPARPQRCSPLEHPQDNTVTGMERFVEALRRAQETAFDPGEYVEQQSFVRASEVRRLAEQAGVGRGVSVLDLCCGVGGPGRFLASELGCDYLGVDASAERSRRSPASAHAACPAASRSRRFRRCLPGEFEVVLLLETMLAFRDKEALLKEIAGALPAGGRFAFTLEEGRPLTESERAQMPDADTVWLTPLDELHALLARAGLAVHWQEDWSEAHRRTAEAADQAPTPPTRPRSQRRSAARRSTSSWPRTGCGPSGSRRDASASSPSWRNGRSDEGRRPYWVFVMTFRTESRIPIAGSVDAVWAYLADVGRWHEWAPTVLEARIAGGAPLQPGARVEQRAKGILGTSRQRAQNVTAVEAPHRMAFAGPLGTSEARWGMELEPLDGTKTDAMMWIEVDLAGRHARDPRHACSKAESSG